MPECYFAVEKSQPLRGTVELAGAKNAALVAIAALLLTRGVSQLGSIPASSDVEQMMMLLEHLGARVFFDRTAGVLTVDTSNLVQAQIPAAIMSRMRASILVMGPLLSRFSSVTMAKPGGCLIGSRPIDFHLKGFKKMGIAIFEDGEKITATMTPEATRETERRVVLEYPSVGATENLMMLALSLPGTTSIINASLEPEVLDHISLLRKMGANIEYVVPQTLVIVGGIALNPVNHHDIIPDRLEAGAILLAAAITKGSVTITNGRPYDMDVFLEKLREMGHSITTHGESGITLVACNDPKAVSIKTAPHPGFPTDLQAPLMAAVCVARGEAVFEETVFENRLMHVRELQKMGAQIEVTGSRARIRGVEKLYSADVIATDIRASCSLVLAGLAASGCTRMSGVAHWRRGYDQLEHKLTTMGARIKLVANRAEWADLSGKAVDSLKPLT